MSPLFAAIDWTYSIIGTIILSIVATVVLNVVLKNRK
jgi:hypothetical protein